MTGPPGPALVDSHCHLADPAFAADRDGVLERAAAAGVTHMVVVASTLDDASRIVDLVRGRGQLAATAGVHPHEARHWSAASARVLRDLLDRPEVVAVGETGLDYHYDHSDRESQRAAFAEQLAIAGEAGKPVVVHAREADQDMARALADAGARTPVILHSFSSGPAVFDAGMAIGAYFSFSGMITFKNWQHQASAAACPSDRLLVETDAPYLAPVPHRGRRNEPAFVREVTEALARARGQSFADVARLTTENAHRVFGALTRAGDRA